MKLRKVAVASAIAALAVPALAAATPISSNMPAVSQGDVVPTAHHESPCGAGACNPCNPCAAKNPCKADNPCAAQNPCGAGKATPCNPCAAE